MSSVVVTIKTSKDYANYNKAGQALENYARLNNLLSGLATGALLGEVYVSGSSADPVAASATITITHANVTNGDTTTILNTAITAATSGNGTTSWTIGADATADATALKNCINANTTLNKQVVATSAAGVVTITALQKGVCGNGFALATSDATAFALVAFSGGAGGVSEADVTIR
jgi:phage tail sheath gpL-like